MTKSSDSGFGSLLLGLFNKFVKELFMFSKASVDVSPTQVEHKSLSILPINLGRFTGLSSFTLQDTRFSTFRSMSGSYSYQESLVLLY